MAATWQIETLKYTNNSDKIVKQAHWRCFHKEEADGVTYSADNIGSVALDEIEASASGFIPYGDLTEAKCLEWVHAKLDKAAIEDEVEASVSEQVNPAVKTGKPWA
jgi:hypothetical protein|tara:strand:- start:939 stop:1256 length:318 start_codon:yes stop_codon:yes gene_type:complete